jgi:rod shape-determining protein MreC
MMVEFFQRRRAGVALLSLLSVSLLCMALRIGPYVAGVKAMLWFFISPEVVYSGEFFNKLDFLSGRLFQLVKVEGENHILRAQNARLSKREVERDVLESENNRLRDLLGLKQFVFPEGVSAEVVGRDLRNWFHAVVINKGSDDRIPFSAAVVSGAGSRPFLLGRVVEVQNDSSKVLLLTDSISAISVTVERTGDIGLLEGRNGPIAALSYLPQHSTVTPGDTVVTVGHGGIFPPGVPIGEVISVTDSEDGFFRQARVRPSADLGAVREVLVVQRREPTTAEEAKKP